MKAIGGFLGARSKGPAKVPVKQPAPKRGGGRGPGQSAGGHGKLGMASKATAWMGQNRAGGTMSKGSGRVKQTKDTVRSVPANKGAPSGKGTGGNVKGSRLGK